MLLKGDPFYPIINHMILHYEKKSSFRKINVVDSICLNMFCGVTLHLPCDGTYKKRNIGFLYRGEMKNCFVKRAGIH